MDNAIITGATKGMGRSIAIAFAKEGINLALCARSESELNVLKAELNQLNPAIKVFVTVADGSDKQQLLEFAADAEIELGAISVIVNSLGMYAQTSILDEDENAFEKMMNTNLAPAYHLYRYFGKKMMAAKNGHVFNICSLASLNPIPAAGTYSVTKAALLSLTKIMRLDMQADGVKVTAVIPGSTLTDSWKGMKIEKGTMVLPEDVASAIVNIYKMSPGANVDEIIIKPAPGQA